jgi:nucleoside-diphosphate kinase
MTGITKSRDAEPGTIRGDFGMSQQYNLIHASENKEAAEKETGLMFAPSEIFSWKKTGHEHIYLPDES